KKANELAPGTPTLNLLGLAQQLSGDYAGAAQSFDRARQEAANDPKVDNKAKAVINANLISAYIGLDKIEQAQQLLPLIKQLDPSNTAAEAQIVNYYATKAQAAQKAGNGPGAAQLFEKAAAVGPTYAADMFTQEANVYANTAKPDWKAVKAAADKALAVKPD